MDKSAEEGAGSQDHVVGMEAQSHLGHYAADLILLDDQVVAGLLEYPQVRLVFQCMADSGLIEHAIGLCTSGAHCRPLAAVKDAELDTALVGGFGHGAAKGVDFLDQMALADAPMAGLQLICPRVSTLWVNSRVFTPMRAAASAASVPAWPPPITITSKRVGKSTTHLGLFRSRNSGKPDSIRI